MTTLARPHESVSTGNRDRTDPCEAAEMSQEFAPLEMEKY